MTRFEVATFKRLRFAAANRLFIHANLRENGARCVRARALGIFMCENDKIAMRTKCIFHLPQNIQCKQRQALKTFILFCRSDVDDEADGTYTIHHRATCNTKHTLSLHGRA